MRVSVLMTAFNREKYIEEAIQSVLQSTLKEFELIVVDDCSTDRTVEIVRALALKDDRIRLYINETNLGDYGNRNKAASLAQAPYIKYVDSDDMIYPHTLQVMVDSMDRFPEAALGLSARDRDLDKDFPVQLSPGETYDQHFFGDGFLENGPLAAIIRKSHFDLAGGFSGKRMIGDIELWLKLSEQYPVVQISKQLVYWRRHEGQEFGQGFKFYLIEGIRVYATAFSSPACPLSMQKRHQAFDHRKKEAFQTLLRYSIKKWKIREGFNLFTQLRKIHIRL